MDIRCYVIPHWHRCPTGPPKQSQRGCARKGGHSSNSAQKHTNVHTHELPQNFLLLLGTRKEGRKWKQKGSPSPSFAGGTWGIDLGGKEREKKGLWGPSFLRAIFWGNKPLNVLPFPRNILGKPLQSDILPFPCTARKVL